MIDSIVRIIAQILIFALLIRAVLSWVVYSGNQYNPTLVKIFQTIGLVTEPLVGPVRKLMARFINTGPMDLAPLVTMILIIVVRNILVAIF